jgi:hypothetical protein
MFSGVVRMLARNRCRLMVVLPLRVVAETISMIQLLGSG